MNTSSASLLFASSFLALAALTGGCALETTSPTPPATTAPHVINDTADAQTSELRIDASAQSYGGDLAVYARLYTSDLATLKVGDGDTLVATLGGKTQILTRENAVPGPDQRDYTTSFSMPEGAVDVTIALERPSDKKSASLVVHVPHAFRLVSSPSTVNASAPVVFTVDPPLAAGENATVRFQGQCLVPTLAEPVVLSARGASDGTVTLDPKAFDFYRSSDADVQCSATVGVRFESYSEPSVGFAKASALGLEERGYAATVLIPKGK